MVVMVFLKSVADIALFFMVLGPAAVHFGASPYTCIITFAAICIAQVLSFLISQKSKKLRFIPYILPFICILLPGKSVTWGILCGIALAYAIFTGAGERYMADTGQQKTLFKITIGMTAAMLVVLLIASATPLSYRISVFSALVSASCSILLLRSLRHEPEVYSRASYQAINLVIIALVILLAVLLGSEPIVRGVGLVLKTVYTWIATAFLFLFNYVIRFFVWIYNAIKGLFSHNITPPPEQKPIQLNTEGFGDLFSDLEEYAGPPSWLKYVVIGIIAAIVIPILIFIFRKLAGKRADAIKEASAAVDPFVRENDRKRFSGQVQGVRKQYRKYLTMVEKEGLQITPDDTSEDICAKAPPAFAGEAARELRALYIDARYNGNSSRDDVERAKELIRELKKERRSGSD